MEEMTSISQAVICEEIFDDSSHPSVAEIRDYASKIGIDPDSEPQLLPLAEEGLMKPLPPGWKPCFDDKNKAYYYHNNITGKTQWEHPLDDIYRGLVVKARTESQSLSLGEPTEDATYTRDDLPSFEEPPPLPQLGKSRKDVKLSPLKSRPKLGELNQRYNSEASDFIPNIEVKLPKQKSEERPSTAVSNRKINLSLFGSFDEKNFKFDKHPQKLHKQELTLTGGGSMFLKTNTKKQTDHSPSPPQNKTESQNQLRGILRENSKNMDIEKVANVDKTEREEDDRKSVRFNVETNPDLTFAFSDESESESGKNPVEDIINVKIASNKSQPQSRFTVFPVQDIHNNAAETKLASEDTENKITRNLKLIKPDPSDFIKPELESQKELQKGILLTTDSEEDSVINGINENKKKVAVEKNVEKVSDGEHTSKSFIQGTDTTSNIENNTTNQQISNELQGTLQNQSSEEVKNLKMSLAEHAQKEIQNYREELFKSQKLEMERILVAEKTKHETVIKQELETLRKEMENRLSGTLTEEKLRLESHLNKQKLDLQEHFETEEQKWDQMLIEKFDVKKQELQKTYNEKLLVLERELEEKLEKSRDELIVSHNAILDQMRQNHAAIIDELQKDFKAEEDIIRREHQKQIADLKIKVTREIDIEKNRTKDAEEERLYEKVRCEKRLLEDKYRCLKDKYLKLKTEVKLSIEKRNRKKEQNLTTTTTTTTTGSETERSPSGKKDRTPVHSPSTNRKHSPKHARSSYDLNKHKPKVDHKIRQIIIQDQDTSASDRSYKNDDKFNRNDSQREYDSSDLDINPGRSRRKLFSRLKSSSTSRINNNVKTRESQRSCSPVENLRKQLQKLEDLEDQFPQNAQGDTYHLRYPFSDGQKFEGSSELEFFRHRIHLERDSIRRAKESLRKQKTTFKQRQNELKLKHGSTARHTLKQLYQEEKELTDMEVSLHRTRSLLGEKVIRLRHLEQSLQRATVTNDEQQKHEDATLSDLSSHSASSGISSTEFAMADSPALKGGQFKESSEIIQSLENLNSEIREIWDVLNKQHQASNVARALPPLPLLYPDLGWPLLAGVAPVPPSIPTLADRLQNYRQHVALANAQSTMVTHDTQGATTTLVEKTRNLRQWLRQTTVDAAVDGSASQATL